MKKFCMAVRVLTVAPVMAVCLCAWLHLARAGMVDRPVDLAAAVVCLAVVPLLSYPLQRFIPGFKDRGREGQRDLAMIFCSGGYCLGLVYALISGAGRGMVCLFLTYLISGLLMLAFNKGLKLRASGHACGVAGPVTMLVARLGWTGLWALPVYLLSGLCSIKMKRHSTREWILGSLLSPAALLLSRLVLGGIV